MTLMVITITLITAINQSVTSTVRLNTLQNRNSAQLENLGKVDDLFKDALEDIFEDFLKDWEALKDEKVFLVQYPSKRKVDSEIFEESAPEIREERNKGQFDSYMMKTSTTEPKKFEEMLQLGLLSGFEEAEVKRRKFDYEKLQVENTKDGSNYEHQKNGTTPTEARKEVEGANNRLNVRNIVMKDPSVEHRRSETVLTPPDDEEGDKNAERHLGQKPPTDPPALNKGVARGGVSRGVSKGVIKRRKRRQNPPTTIYRRKPAQRPCRRTDGTSAVFSGGNAMSYISFLANVMALVLNINNNINNNNNNNNINSNNNIDNNNANLNINSNNVNQVNVMPPGGKRRRRGLGNALHGREHSCAPSSNRMLYDVLEMSMREAWMSLTTQRFVEFSV